MLKKERLFGRKAIYTSEKEINANNICEVISKAFAIHECNRNEIQYLMDYVKGKQPILTRVKEVRPEICNKIVENHALEINNFKIGFIFGEPVQYVKRGNCELDNIEGDYPNDSGIASLNEYMQVDGKSSKDRELAEWINTCGVGYRIVLPSDIGSDMPFETFVLDARNTFVVYSNDFKHKPMLACTYTNNCTLDEYKLEYKHYYIYTEDKCFEISGDKVVSESINPIGAIPIIEYNNNPSRIGSFECVIELCDAINNISSNSIDSIEQNVQALLWFDNCDISSDDFEKLKDLGAIKTKSEVGNPANIKSIKIELDLSQTQQNKDDLYDRMLTIASVPDRRASAGGNTGQALIIGEGWVNAESAAKAFELMFIKPEKKMLDIVLKICRDSLICDKDVKEIKLHDVDIKFTRNKTDNLVTKTQGLMNMLQSGIHPRIAISNCGLFSDPEQVYQDSKPYLEKLGEEDNANVATPTGTDEMLKALDQLTVK